MLVTLQQRMGAGGAEGLASERGTRSIVLPHAAISTDRDVAGSSIHCQMHLTSLPSALWAVLPGQPLSIAKEFDPGAVHQEFERLG